MILQAEPVYSVKETHTYISMHAHTAPHMLTWQKTPESLLRLIQGAVTRVTRS